MSDPQITLFGRRILLKGDGEDENYKEVSEEESMENDKKNDSFAKVMDESTNAPSMSETTSQSEKPVDSKKDSECQEDEKESKDSDPKVLKKPDKLLPCPRCNSMDTRFCYYNNYNVNQPRHFCKSCQRYWTAGGTMRNVPVGAGRRKNKSSSSRYCQITVSEALQAIRFEDALGVHHPGLKTNGTVLTFGSESPLCEPVTSVISIADKTVFNGSTRNGFNNRDDGSSVSTVTNGSIEDPLKKCAREPKQHINGFSNPIPGGFQWPYMWNPAIPFCAAVFPMPIFPHQNWNGAPMPMNIPWVVAQSQSIQKSPESNPNSQTLGKRTRDEEMATPRTVLMPKTLRIDNPDEAAKSSIWSTLGIKKDNKGDSISKVFFNSFESKKPDKKDSEIEATPVAFTKTNPVALCRSFDFQERA